jgi:predicted MFS family arabinose efflux permease
MLLQLFGLCLAAPGLLAVHFAPSAAMLVACLFVFGFGRGLWDCNNMPIFCDVVVPEARSTAYGVFNLANTLGGGLGVLVAGVLRQSFGIGATLSAFSGLLLISAALTWLATARFLPRDMSRIANR